MQRSLWMEVLCSIHILTFAKKFVGTYMFATDEKMIPYTQKSSGWVTSMRYLMLQTLQLEKNIQCPNKYSLNFVDSPRM